MKAMKNTLLLATVAAGLATAGAAQANVVNIQFASNQGWNQGSFNGNQGAYTGDSVATPTWNVATVTAYPNPRNGAMSSLLASNGAVTTDSVSYSYQTSYSTAPTSPSNKLLEGYLASVSSYGQGVTLSGLTDSGTYELYLYASNGSYGGGASKFVLTAGTGGPIAGSNAATTGNASGASSGTFTENASYVIFDVTATATGTIGITSDPITGNPSYNNTGLINGLQLVSSSAAVPEPASLALLGAGALGLLLIGRKRSTT